MFREMEKRRKEKKSEYQKLIDLLNEYEDPFVSWYEEYVEEFGVFTLSSWQATEEEVIISKSFWFIQRLVEHNKLLHPDFVLHQKLFYGDSMPEHNFYLMMLSIADRPIAELNKMLRP